MARARLARAFGVRFDEAALVTAVATDLVSVIARFVHVHDAIAAAMLSNASFPGHDAKPAGLDARAVGGASVPGAQIAVVTSLAPREQRVPADGRDEPRSATIPVTLERAPRRTAVAAQLVPIVAFFTKNDRDEPIATGTAAARRRPRAGSAADPAEPGFRRLRR
jgi:hypothetical protein